MRNVFKGFLISWFISSLALGAGSTGRELTGSTILNGSGVLTIPTSTDTLVGRATTDTLTNKTLVAPALGTPASGVMTNVTGTASGLTAGSVTTNANLTGVITSSGNATSTGSQTGTFYSFFF
jgi:hypothetical protein